MRSVHRWGVFETFFESNRHYDDPLRDVSVRCVFSSSNGEETAVDAFWDGENE